MGAGAELPHHIIRKGTNFILQCCPSLDLSKTAVC